MAFRQPTHAPQRIYTAPTQTDDLPAHHDAQRPADEQEWVLFSPAANSSTNRTYTATTVTRTAGRSRVSDFGSLNTAARSYDFEQQSEDEAVLDEDEVEEDAELDSLDSHLHEFRSEPSVYRRAPEASGTVLPTHDGLGSFRIDRPSGMGEEVQEHLYAFERYNPRRAKRRRESLELGQIELENERAADAERIQRIEKWRMEQSRLLVNEIQKETRRRKLSMSTDKRSVMPDLEQEDLATLSTIGTQSDDVDAENETFWNRITRRVIRDLIGIDDDMLSIIFGEALPDDDDLSTTPPANSIIRAEQGDRPLWEHKIIERIARELGILANQISEHPGAFNTYLRTQQVPLPYAGLPVIPEFSRDQPSTAEADIQQSTATMDPVFEPTIQPQAAPVSIPVPTTSLAQSSFIDENATPRPSQHILTREEWEADLDIKLVFSYLRNRFTSKFHSSPSHPSCSIHTTSHLATASTADTAARAARVRQHHPLVTRETRERERRRSIERRTWKVSVPESGVAGLRPRSSGRRGSSSCASERLVAAGVGVRSGSSRHYWDFGPGSVGSGSLVGGVGGGGGVMGSWGEV